MSRARARNDGRWSAGTKRQICERKGWKFAYVEDSPRGAGWYTEEEYTQPYKGFRYFEFGRYYIGGNHWRNSYSCILTGDTEYVGPYWVPVPDPIGPFVSLDAAVEWVYRVKELYKGFPDNSPHRYKVFLTARHSETRRGQRKAEKSGKRWDAKRRITKDMEDMAKYDEN
jgi:hypothetical protein